MMSKPGYYGYLLVSTEPQLKEELAKVGDSKVWLSSFSMSPTGILSRNETASHKSSVDIGENQSIMLINHSARR